MQKEKVRMLLTAHDHEFRMKHLESFIPSKIYDMHTHIWTEKGQDPSRLAPSSLRMEAGTDELRCWSNQLFGDRECHYLLLGTPLKNMNRRNHNLFLQNEVQKDELSIAGMIATADMSPEEMAENFDSGHFHAVKPYRVFADDPAHARITDFIPEKLLEVVDHYRMAVTLHLSFPSGAAAPENQADLKYLTSRYPGIKWILAHCARAFNANFLTDSIHVLKHLPNIYYDTSAVNDLYTHYLLLKYEDRKRIMFGSDNIVAGGVKGKYVTYADSWFYLPGQEHLEHCPTEAVPVVYEQLLQQKRAADMLEMNRYEIEDLFFRNAENLIAVLKKRLP